MLASLLPLLLLGWVITSQDERELRRDELERERAFAGSWGIVFAREDVIARWSLMPAQGERARRASSPRSSAVQRSS